ncbi:MAG: hypothetical protein LBR48_02120 [Dysgonamonadaceae bacterium]|jgi:cell division protein FtsQ|nr:hypothetical protein [Dysgonamonadaceae bacterium]
MKKFLVIFGALLIVGYLVFAVFYFGKTSQTEVCDGFEVIVKDSVNTKFIQSSEVEALVKQKGLNPVGKLLREVNTLAIKEAILTNRLVKSADVYTTAQGVVVATIYQRKPVLRVIPDAGASYYIDNNRERMPVSLSYAVYVPLVTGSVKEDYAKNELYDFAQFLNNNPDWDAWVDQIVVRKNRDVEIVPRIGDFRIVLGKLDNYPAKLAKFTLFIEKGLNVVGWNRYSEVNLKYDNQVVCTKK